MTAFPLNLLYKGERSYLHGTDIINETMGWLTSSLAGAEATDIDFSFHRPARRQLTATLEPPRSGAAPASVCVFTAGGVRRKVYLVETDQPVTGRYPYPEDEIVAAIEIDKDRRTAVLSGTTPYTEIEVWVAITKTLHLHVFSNLTGKWWFVRGHFPKYVRHANSPRRELTITGVLGDRLTRTQVLLDGVKAADIHFSIV